MKKQILFVLSLLLLTFTAYSQTVVVKGTVIDGEDKQPIIGANISTKNASVGTITDINGNFSLNISKGSTIVVSYIGYKSHEQKINSEMPQMTIVLASDAIMLDEFVAIGYGTVKKSDVTGAVASVSGEQLRKLPGAGVDKALQGLSPGVTVVSNSGQPGSDVVVRIRGIGTVNNASPLYVVDGVPVDNINFLSPNDIKSTEILKDASSTAIYGARGANGVILITTNGGTTDEKFSLSADIYYGIQNRGKKLNMMNSDQLSQFWGYKPQTDGSLTDWVYKNFAGSKDYIPKNLNYSDYNTDWQDAVFQENAPIQNYYLTASGGFKKLQYMMSAGYFDQKGIIMDSYYKRFTFRINTSAQVKKWLKLGENLSFMASSNRDAPNNSDNYSMLNSAIRFAPWDPLRYPDGGVSASSIANYPNPLSMSEYIHPSNSWNRLVGNAYLEITPIEGLVFKSDYGIDLSIGRNSLFKDKYSIAPYDKMENNFVSQGFERYITWTIENTLTYTKTFGKHNLSAMVGQTVQEYSYYTLGSSRTNVVNPKPENWYISMADGEYTTSDGVGRSRMASFLGRVNYSYDNRYLFTANFRADGSSKFPVNNLWGFFPSFSAAWKISEESFFASAAQYVPTLKLRVGWGQIGNEKISTNNFYPKVQTGSQFVTYVFGNPQELAYGATMTSLPSQFLKWETTNQFNVGVDFGLFNSQLTGSVDYYIKDTEDMLLNVVLPSHIGMMFTSPDNVGQVRNQGLELILNWRQQVNRNFSYSIGGNLATVQNNFTKMGTSSPIYGEGFKGENLVVSQEGFPLYSFYGYQYDGIIQNQQEADDYCVRDAQGNPVLDQYGDRIQIIPGVQAGDVRYVDRNNDGKITDLDKTILGSSFPTLTYGFNASFEFYGFDISLFFQGVAGNQIYNCNRVLLEGGEGNKNTNLSTDMLQSWTTENPSTNMPRAYGRASNFWASDRFLEDGSYLRLKNMQLGYQFPKKWMDAIKMQGIKLYVSGSNLLTFTNYTGYDPEASFSGVDRGNYPQAITVIFGAKIDF